MARTEHDREDLLREATALVERAELQIPGCGDPIVVGFRSNGSFSCYFGGDPVYQFSSASELRRAFVAGLLYKAERGQLVALRRERSANETVLLRQPCDDRAQAELLNAARDRLAELHLALEQQRYTLTGQVPSDCDVVGKVRHWLAALPAELSVASSPHSG
jgi:hypothetical protein